MIIRVVKDGMGELGNRISELRKQAGLTQEQFGHAVGLHKTAISKLENDTRRIKSSELVLISKTLGVSPMAILDPKSLQARLPVARRGEDTFQTDAAYQHLVWLSELHSLLAEEGIPATKGLEEVPDATDGAKPWRDSEYLAKWATQKLEVKAHGLDRMSAIAESIEERLGVDVLVERFDGNLSGAAITDREFPLIFVNARYPSTRGLFTLAHELGHLLLDCPGEMTLDRDMRGASNPERTANAFAAAFLMPREAIDELAGQYENPIERLVNMVDYFGVSLETLVYRLHNLGRIRAEHRDEILKTGWNGLLDELSVLSEQRKIKSYDEDALRDLYARSGAHPGYRSPGLLLARCEEGLKRDIISATPLHALRKAELPASITTPDFMSLSFTPPSAPSSDIAEDDFLVNAPF